MLKRIKKFIEPLSKLCPPVKDKSPISISFRKTEDTVCSNQRSTNEEEREPQERSLMQWFHEEKLKIYSVIDDNVLLPLIELVPDIFNSNHLLNLTDMRIVDEDLFSTQAANNEDVEMKPRCNEQPKPFVFEELTSKQSPLIELDLDIINQTLPLNMMDLRYVDEDFCTTELIQTQMQFSNKYKIDAILKKDKRIQKKENDRQKHKPDIEMEIIKNNIIRNPELNLNGFEINIQSNKKIEEEEKEINEKIDNISREMDVYTEKVKRYLDRQENGHKLIKHEEPLWDVYTEILIKYYKSKNNEIIKNEKKEWDVYTEKLKKYYQSKSNKIIKIEETNEKPECDVYTQKLKKYFQLKNDKLIKPEKKNEKPEWEVFNQLLKKYYRSKNDIIIKNEEKDEKTKCDIFTKSINMYYKRRLFDCSVQRKKTIDETMNSKKENVTNIKTYNLRKINPNLKDIAGFSTIYKNPKVNSYISSMIEMNKILENKIMTSKQRHVKTLKTPLDLKTEFKEEHNSDETKQ